MIRQIIHIDEEKCNGCGICAEACHEGAIEMVDGKAKLVRENFCDGFGDCLPACPTGAITFEEREAPEYDEAAVKINKMMKELHAGGCCPGVQVAQFAGAQGAGPASESDPATNSGRATGTLATGGPAEAAAPLGAQPAGGKPVSRLAQWPCQIKLVPIQAPFFEGAKLLIAADCTAFAYAALHEDYMKGRVTIIGCPKLDDVDYTDKLTQIIALNDIREVTIVRMEVPCCGGLQRAAENALKANGKFIPWQVVTISRDGRVLD